MATTGIAAPAQLGALLSAPSGQAVDLSNPMVLQALYQMFGGPQYWASQGYAGGGPSMPQYDRETGAQLPVDNADWAKFVQDKGYGYNVAADPAGFRHGQLTQNGQAVQGVPQAQWSEPDNTGFNATRALVSAALLAAGGSAAIGGGTGTGVGTGVAGGSASTGNMALIDSGLGTAGYGGSSAGTIAMGDGLGSAASGALTDYGASAEANQAAPEIANTGSDAHFYQPQQGGPGVQDLGNMGGAGTATIPSMTLQNPSNFQQLQQLLTSKAGQQALGSLGGNNGLAGTALAGLFGLGASALGPQAGDMNIPNYAAAAQSQSASGRMDQSNPWANLSYTQNGVDAQGNPVYKQNVSLNPADQANLDSARSGQGAALFGLGNSINGYDAAVKALPGLYGDKGTQQGLTQQAIDAMYHQQTALLDPQYQEQQRALQSQLANQGVVQGSQAWNQAMDSYARQRDYAYGNARDSSINQGNSLANQLFSQNLAAHQTGMQDLSTQQNQYLTDANGLSNTVKTPSFQATPSPTNYLGAAALQGQGNLNQYNASVGNANSFSNGLFNLGGAVMSNPAWTTYLGNLFSTGGG